MNVLSLITLFSTLYIEALSTDAVLESRDYAHEDYHMDPYITCFEQNEEIPYGYRDPIYTDPTNSMYEEYMITGEYPGTGDVCDHADSVYKEYIRDTCYFQVTFGEEITEKTWTYKCRYHRSCPLVDDDGP